MVFVEVWLLILVPAYYLSSSVFEWIFMFSKILELAVKCYLLYYVIKCKLAVPDAPVTQFDEEPKIQVKVI